MVAGVFCAIAAIAFFLVAQHRDVYLAQGKDLIPDALLPKDIKTGASSSSDLLQRFPNDPRSHFYKAWSFIYSNDLGGADSELHIALENPVTFAGDLPRQFAPTVKSTLALVLQAEGQSDSAQSIAKEVCGNSDLPSQIRGALQKQKLCD
jgi:rhomboid protease GluP